MKKYVNKALCVVGAVPVAFAAAIPSTFAASGIGLTAAAITGAQTGLQEAAGSIETTVNNQYFITLAVMFIGFAVVVGMLSSLIRGHRRI